jgi:sulfofructose kinase
MKNVDVLCVGVTSYDFYFMLDHHPDPDEKTIADAFLSCGGGPAANAAVTIAKMGLSVALAGYLGNDLWGELHSKELKQSGVLTDWIVRGNKPTPISTILVKPDGKRSLVNYRDNNATLEKNAINFSNINLKIILFDGHEPDISMELLKQIKDDNVKTILDAGSVNPGTLLLFDKVDYLICSAKFAEEITGSNKMGDALKKLSNQNENIVITLGEQGLIWKTKMGQGKLNAYPIVAVDTTGAGDVFHGAFAGSLAMNKDLQEILKYSSAAAALSCTKPGGRTSIPTIKEVENFVNERKFEYNKY